MKLAQLAQLRDFLNSMEESSGLTTLSSVQRDVFYAAALLAEETTGAVPAKRTVVVDDLLRHRLVAAIARPTAYRAIQALIAAQLITRVGTERSGIYEVHAGTE